MGFFWIGINHTSHGIIKVSSKKRLVLELISGIILLISWFIIGFGIKEAVITPDSWERRDSNHYVLDLDRISAVSVFVVGNGVYLITTFVLVIFNLIYRRGILMKNSAVPRSEWMERGKHDICFDICNPLNGLRIFHHLEHRGAFLINLAVMFLRISELNRVGSFTVGEFIGDNIFCFAVVLMVIKLVQSLLSYFYAEDVALCGLPICGCFHFWFIRRYPQEESDEERLAPFENPPKYDDVVQHV